jgi:peptidoglycan/xylan/chitin deacetylase (PgdA/CDA1 family)
MAEHNVPWTAYVEGQFFEARQALCRGLEARGVDVQLHCYDHGDSGDTPESIARSAAVYADCLGRRPSGYRAHTYRLTRELYDALRAEGFRWDSSLMRAFAQGGNRQPGFLGGDYLVLDGDFFEFPIGTWRGTPVPFNHTHLLLARKPGEQILKRVFGPTRLVVYNCHMTDLVRSGSLAYATRSRSVRLLYGYLWTGRGGDTFPVLRGVIRHLRAKGYAFKATQELWTGLTSPAS